MEQLACNDNEWNGKALYWIGKIRAKEKNFYEAYHAMNRLPQDSMSQKIADFHKFVEGVIFLAKRKTKGAIKLLNDVIESPVIKPYYKAKAYSYRAYANMTNHQFQVFSIPN